MIDPANDPAAAERGVTTWAFVVGEYPPQAAGVADYTRQVAESLSLRGDTVHVYAPPTREREPASGVQVHRLGDRFGPRALLQLIVRLRRLPKPRRIVVQYVPQSFGMRALNFPFVLSLLAMRGLPLWVMFHEFAIVDDPRASPWKRLQAFGTRVMAVVAARSAQRAFVSTPAWSPLILRASRRHKEITWLPVPSNVPATKLPEVAVARVRADLGIADDALVLGHFGTYSMIETCRLLQAIVPAVLESDPARRFFLLGRNSREFASALLLQYPQLESRLLVSGELAPGPLAAHLGACDVMVQPFGDGVTTRRGSLIAGLALGIPTVSTTGERTEAFWESSDALLLADGDARSVVDAIERVARDPELRERLAFNARELYQMRFDVRHTVDALRDAVATEDPVVPTSSILERMRWLIRGRSTMAAVMQTATLQIATLVLNLATGVLTARLLAPAGRGELLAINLVPTVMAYLLTLGIPAALLYELKRDPANARKLLGASLVTVSVLSACAVCIGYLILPFALHRYPANVIQLARFFMLTTPFALFVYIGGSVFDSVGNLWYANILRFSSPLMTLMFLCAFWGSGRLNVMTAAASYALPGVVIGVKVLYDTLRGHRPSFFPFIRKPYVRLLSYGVRSFGLEVLRTIGDQIDQLLVVAFLSPAAMGLYAVALVISRALQTFQMATVRVLLPTIAARPLEEVIDAVGRATRLTAAISTPLCIGLIALGPFILHLVYGTKYAAADGPLRILAVESVFAGTTWILAQAFLAIGKPGIVTALQALGLGVSFPLMLVLIPRFGLIGAGLSLTISTLVRFSLALLCFPWLLKKAPPNLLLTRSDVAGLWQRFGPKRRAAPIGAP